MTGSPKHQLVHVCHSALQGRASPTTRTCPRRDVVVKVSVADFAVTWQRRRVNAANVGIHDRLLNAIEPAVAREVEDDHPGCAVCKIHEADERNDEKTETGEAPGASDAPR